MTQILVVDDDRAIREMLQVALEVEGYTVTTFSDGRLLLETLVGLQEPALVLLDLMMPGVSGWDVCARLEARPELLGPHRVIVMTAGLLPGDRCPPPASALLRKPFTLERLYATLERLLAPCRDDAPVAIYTAGDTALEQPRAAS